jgi:hypothetical protein
MKTIVKKTITLETKKYDFDNEFAYIEQWSNSHLKDCYFAEKEFLFPDGSVKNEGKKYFYSPLSGSEIEKEIEAVDCLKFKWFDKLYFYNSEGEIIRIDGKPAEEVFYNFEEDEAQEEE